jgi:hypothetical protein
VISLFAKSRFEIAYALGKVHSSIAEMQCYSCADKSLFTRDVSPRKGQNQSLGEE